jgi:hypothetical protein
MQWEATGYFGAFMRPINGSQTLFANRLEKGTGGSYVPDGGDYHVKVNAMGKWRLKAVALPPGQAPESANVSQPDTESQANLPPCDGPDATEEIKELVLNSPWGQVTHIRVLDVGPITKTASPKGVEVCHAKLITTGGDINFDFQNVRTNGKIYMSGRRR